MTVSTFYSTVADGVVGGYSSVSYALCAIGNEYSANNQVSQWERVGQAKYGSEFFIMQEFIPWDTSSIPDGDSVTDVEIGLYGRQSNAATTFKVQCGVLNFSDPLLDTDFQTLTELAALTPLAEHAISDGWALDAYNLLTPLSGLNAAINKTGLTKLVFFSDRNRAGIAPTGDEFVDFWMAEQTAAPERRPRLIVTHGSSSPTGSGAGTLKPPAAVGSGTVVVGSAGGWTLRLGF